MSLYDIAQKIANSSQHRGTKWHLLKGYILAEMESGKYSPGDLLPSENQLSSAIGVARNTVRQAMSVLEKDGLVYRVKGSGTFVSQFKPHLKKKNLEAYSLIIPEIRRSLYPSLCKGFDFRAGSEHHQVLICNTDYDINKQADIILQIVDKKISGVAMVPPTFQVTPAHHIRQLHSNSIPVVFCHRRIPDVSAPFVGWDWEQVGRLAGQAFVDRGHRDIMYYGVYRYEVSQAYEVGLRQVLNAHGLQLPEHRVLYGPRWTTPNGDDIKEKMLCSILQSKNRPTAVFCSDDNEAERFYWLAHTLGIRVPEELSIIGFGDTLRDTVFRKQLVSVAVNEFELGAKAADILSQMCKGRRPIDSNESFMMELKLTGEGTLGSVPRTDYQNGKF